MAEEKQRALLNKLAQHPLCDFFFRKCVESMSDEQVADDLAAEPDLSLLQHFHESDQMHRLEELFSRAIETFHLSKEQLKGKAEFNFDIYNIRNFESVRAVFRLANALSDVGFRDFLLLRDHGLADLIAMKDDQRWFVEVKTLVLQTRPQEFEVDGRKETLTVDKFQPESCNLGDYVENVSRLVARNHIQEARSQLLRTVEKIGAGKKMAAIVVNLFAAELFLDDQDLGQVEARLRGRATGWGKDYLTDIDTLAFLTNQLYLFPCA